MAGINAHYFLRAYLLVYNNQMNAVCLLTQIILTFLPDVVIIFVPDGVYCFSI